MDVSAEIKNILIYGHKNPITSQNQLTKENLIAKVNKEFSELLITDINQITPYYAVIYELNNGKTYDSLIISENTTVYNQKLSLFIESKQNKINEISETVKKAVVANIFAKLNKRLPEFTVLRNEKYSDCTNDLTYHDIEKGDIILSVTHNDLLMAIDGENVVHHATLCIKTPESNADTAFITIEGVGKNIAYFSLDDIRDNDDTAYVMRCKDITTEQINKIAEFAQNQIGKPYNTNFIKKEEEESFYCTQLVWAAYKAAGIEIDFNANEINDYGVVLATDIYKSPNLKLVKYSD